MEDHSRLIRITNDLAKRMRQAWAMRHLDDPATALTPAFLQHSGESAVTTAIDARDVKRGSRFQQAMQAYLRNRQRFLDDHPVSILRMAKPQKRNLVYLRAGAASVHTQWLTDAARSWDLLISAYDPTWINEPRAGIIIHGGGTKFVAAKRLFEKHNQLLDHYEHVLFLDDDVLPRYEDVDRLFDICERERLALAQASLTPDSYHIWSVLVQRPNSCLRYTNCVEIMMPVFSCDALRRCLKTFDFTVSGYGLDLLWGALVNYRRRSVAVIDAVAFRHTKPIDQQGGAFYRLLRSYNIDSLFELKMLCKRLHLDKEIREIASRDR